MTRAFPRMFDCVEAVEWSHALAHAMQKLWLAQWKRCEKSSGSVASLKLEGSTPKGAGPLFRQQI